MIKLVVKAKVSDSETREYSYEFDQPVVTLGRLKENDIPLPVSTVSGYHAQILNEGDNYYITDRGSINGTYLNGQILDAGEKKLLQDGDVIRIQSFEIYFWSGMTAMKIDQGATVQVARQMVMEVLGSWGSQQKERPRIIIMGGPDNGKQFELTEGQNMVIGRGRNCEITIEHPSISRRHAEITFSWNGAFIKDLNSVNGVYLNDQRINGSHKLRDRDEVRLGQHNSSNPIHLIFSNPAEALLSQLEQLQDSSPQMAVGAASDQATIASDSPPAQPNLPQNATVAENVQVSAAAAKGSAVASAAAAQAASPEMQQSQQDAAPPPAPEPVSDPQSAPVPPVAAQAAGEAMPAPAYARQRKQSPAGAIAGIVVLLLILGGVAYYFLSPAPLPVMTIEPGRGEPGDVIAVKVENIDASTIKNASLLQRSMPILKTEGDRIEIKIPAYPNLEATQRQGEMVLEGDAGVVVKAPFTLIVPAKVDSIEPASGVAGTEVRIVTSSGAQSAGVFFGSNRATVKSVSNRLIVAEVPRLSSTISESGTQVAVRVEINDIPAKGELKFNILPEMAVQSIEPQSATSGTEVTIRLTENAEGAEVYFGGNKAEVKNAQENQIVAIVPAMKDVSPAGSTVPVEVRVGEKTIAGNTSFTVMPAKIAEPEVFRLTFTGKPFPRPLGFNEHMVESNIGPFLLMVAKDEYGSSSARADAVAQKLNQNKDFFRQNPSAKVLSVREGDAIALYADAGSATDRRLLARVFADDALAYGKLNQRVVQLEDLGEWWRMLIDSYYKTFVQIQSPGSTGILSAGGNVLQQVYSFYSQKNRQGQKFYSKDFLENLPADQKNRLVSLSLSPPRKLARVDGKWTGSLTNNLYPNISEETLELILTLRQNQEGSVSGTAEVNWKVGTGESEGGYRNVAYKKLGTYKLSGSYQKTRSFPLEFSFVDKEGRRLNFVGRIQGERLAGSFAISATGEEGNWDVALRR